MNKEQLTTINTTLSSAVGRLLLVVFTPNPKSLNQQIHVLDAVPHSTKHGFTLVELLIVIGIFSVLTGVVLSNYRTYDTNALFANASEDLVLAIRQAQVYGVGVKRMTGCGTSNFDCSYGVYLSKDVLERNEVTVFADINGNRIFDPLLLEDAGLEGASVKWGNSIFVSSLLCGGLVCIDDKVSITFRRPNPDAFIADTAPLSTSTSPYNFIDATLIDSNTGRTTHVKVTRAGQISIE